MERRFDFVARSRFEIPAGELFAWHARPGAFERLAPPWDPPRVLERTGGIRDGDRLTLQVNVGPLPVRWVVEHFGYDEGKQFRDRQVQGPFVSWEHTHRVIPDGPGAAFLEDHIAYELPGGALGARLGRETVEEMLLRSFAFRHRRLAADLERHRAASGKAPLTVAITGASGLIGATLASFLTSGGHRVLRLVRRSPTSDHPPGEDEVFWDPQAGDQGEIDGDRLESVGVDAVVHLAGENVGERWTESRKRRIRDSRIRGTGLIARTLAGLSRPPRVLVSASAVGIYGARDGAPIDESAPAGSDFLAEVATAWEAAAAPAAARGIRVVHPRTGVVLTPGGGALARLLPVFRMGAGGRVGSGKQGMSWVDLDDVVGALYHALHCDDLTGPFNLTAPNPVTNAEFARTLGRVLERPAVFPVPAAALSLAFGEMAQSMLLSGVQAVPRRLESTGFRFLHPELGPALEEMLGKRPPPDARRNGNRLEVAVV